MVGVCFFNGLATTATLRQPMEFCMSNLLRKSFATRRRQSATDAISFRTVAKSRYAVASFKTTRFLYEKPSNCRNVAVVARRENI